MSELLDIYDENQVHIGVKERADVHRDGDWHKVFHCWVVYRGADGVDYLVMQMRGPDKDTFPNLLDVTAAGHYQAGEDIRDGIREVQEELGIAVDFDDLVPLGQHIGVSHYDGLIDRQFCDVFLLVHNQDIKQYHYQKEELAGLVVFSIQDGLNLLSGKVEKISAKAAGLGKDVLMISLDDFVPREGDYMDRLLLLAIRCLNGEHNLAL
ncbi:MAG: NUDIX domain-containing protein [Anaerolineae bacterium]|nr:NUDIX domain-containing protein [Anaerolineae bacterium]